jgi:hypothetical protein
MLRTKVPESVSEYAAGAGHRSQPSQLTSRWARLCIVIRIDHVIWAVAGLDRSHQLRQLTGLAALEGGKHPQWGTENMIVPLGSAYLELITVRDGGVAAQSPLGRRVSQAIRHGEALAGWAVEVDDLAATASRLGLDIQPGRRLRPDGSELSWRMAGVELAMQNGLPFFIEWGAERPGTASANHANTPLGFAWLEVGNPVEELERWLGPNDLDLRQTAKGPGLMRAAIWTGSGEVVVPLDLTVRGRRDD